MTKRIFISACEPSAELHCTNLINAVQQTTYAADTPIEFVGLGGEKMAAAGCILLENTVHKAAMIQKAFSQVGRFIKLLNRVKSYFKSTSVDLVIVCDSPAFNFHIAKLAKKRNIPVLFYVAPQLWAWAPWRIHKLRKCCTRLAPILPFEQEWFTTRGIDTTYVGNPLLDEIDIDSIPPKNYTNFDPKNATIALLPGSRDAEISSLWPPMQTIALRLQNKFPSIKFTASAVSEQKLSTLKQLANPSLNCTYVIDDTVTITKKSDLAIVASGSATLQVAATTCPMVVIYQANPVLWHLLGKWLITSKYLSLVNILAGYELVPEFMPYFKSIDPIYEKALALLRNPHKLQKTSTKLREITNTLGDGNTSKKVANIACNMLSK